MIVVSDASPLIALARIATHGVLPILYDTVLVPRSVHEEVVLRAPEAPGARAVQAVNWLVVADVQKPSSLPLASKLDRGEADALTLAVEHRADLLLIDEQRGRHVARASGLAVIGTVGVLVEATRRGLVPDLARLLDALRAEGFYLDEALHEKALTALRRS